MKALFSPEQNDIIAYGIGYNDYEGENIVEVPNDFSKERYIYVPNEDGTFNENGIFANPEFIEII